MATDTDTDATTETETETETDAASDSFAAPDEYRCKRGAEEREQPPAPDAYQEVFATLRTQGVVTVEGDSCCSSCADYEAGVEASKLQDEGHAVAGTATYHAQDIDRGYDRLLIGYCGRDYPVGAIAGMIAAAAADAGLEVEWDGSCSQKVELRQP